MSHPTRATCRKSHILLFLHGSGDTGDNFRATITSNGSVSLADDDALLLFPTAPLRPYTPMNGCMSHVWFDRPRLHYDATEDARSLAASVEYLDEVLESQRDHVVEDADVFVIGFSMGGALALHFAFHRMRVGRPVRAVLVMSSFIGRFSDAIPDCADLRMDDALGMRPPLIKMVHGSNDEMVLSTWGEETARRLAKSGFAVEFTSIQWLQHELPPECIQLVTQFVDKA